MTNRIRFAITFSCLAFVTAAFADSVTYTGTTTGGPTWNRPLAGTPPSGLSAVGTAVRYSTQSFSVDLSGSYTFLSTATSPPLWDNFTFLYLTSFNAASPFNNVLIGNDDNPSIGLSGFTFNLTAGASYIFVTTGFANTDFGTFSNMISGLGNVRLSGAAVPESAPGLMIFGLVVVGLVVAQRRFARS